MVAGKEHKYSEMGSRWVLVLEEEILPLLGRLAMCLLSMEVPARLAEGSILLKDAVVD